MPFNAWIVLLATLVSLATLFFLFQVASVFQLWLQGRLAGAPVLMTELLRLKLKGAPYREIVRWQVLAAQSGIHASMADIEQALSRDVDLEFFIRALRAAHEQGQNPTWAQFLAEYERIRPGSATF